MKKIFVLLFLTSAFNSLVNGQAAKSAFFELGGPGLASLNFDTRFGNNEGGIGGRVGIGGFSLKIDDKSAGVLFIPIGINYLIGKDQKNYFEIGAGITPVITSSSSHDTHFSTTFGHALFGYRMQPKEGGFTFRAFVCPVYGKFGFIPYYGGVSLGYKFGGNKSK